jgi:hypothetical protein
MPVRFAFRGREAAAAPLQFRLVSSDWKRGLLRSEARSLSFAIQARSPQPSLSARSSKSMARLRGNQDGEVEFALACYPYDSAARVGAG